MAVSTCALPFETVSTLLRVPPARRHAAPWLVALTVAVLVRVVPYLFVFAGVADTHGWLAFAPCDLALSWGPLYWGYVTAVTSGAPVRSLQRHFVPGAVHLAYQVVCILLPLNAKERWYFGAHGQFVEPAVAAITLVSLSLYGFAAWNRYASWRASSGGKNAADDDHRLWLLRAVLGGIALTVVAGAVLLLVHLAVTPLIYLAQLPEATAFATFAYAVTVLGVRAAQIPTWPNSARPNDSTPSPVLAARSTNAYRAQADNWRTRVATAGWHRDSSLTLETLASALHTSPRTLSRTLKEGLGVSFNTFVNDLRVDEATNLLAAPNAPTVLEVAFAVGFASKASFHRAFKRRTNGTPSELRARRESQNPPNSELATDETTG